jgi:hypothetical protein
VVLEMKRGGRKTPVNPVGRRKLREQREKLVDGPLCDKVKAMPCCVCGVRPVDPHHVSGGTLRRDYLPDGTGNVVPLCRKHHTGDEGVHTLGRETFAATFGIDLGKIAKELGDGGIE